MTWMNPSSPSRGRIDMATKYILLALAVIFLVLAVMRLIRTRNRSDPAARTWLIIGVIFAAVGTWLWLTI